MAKKTPRRSTGDRLQSLHDSVERLIDHVACLTAAVDELAEHVQWRNHNVTQADNSYRPTLRVSSMPVDPATDDWQINRISRHDLPAHNEPTELRSQQLLFAREEKSHE